jgi:hypothetical protein
MRFFKFIRIAWRLSSTLPLGGRPRIINWDTSDANALRQFLTGTAGTKLRAILLNMVLRQNSHVVMQCDKKNLQIEAGYANGMRTTVHTLEALAKELSQWKNLQRTRLGSSVR